MSYSRNVSDTIKKMRGAYDDKVKFIREKKRKKEKDQVREDQRDKYEITKENLKEKEQKVSQLSVDEFGEPNTTVFIQNIAPEATKEVLDDLFGQYPGFAELRFIPEKSVAWAEFESLKQSKFVIIGT
jgi:RNA recognition motif-containing protein